MEQSTTTALHRLKDAEFHALCDEIIPRIYPPIFPITPHGRNERGDSVRGQPDSYVGDSATTCQIAIQYSVQRRSWWAKVVDEVREARAACPQATQIIVALPLDIDREKPKGTSGAQWRQDAENAAAPASLTIIHGRQISYELDTSSQDLRRIHLGIPCSRASFQTLSASCRESSERVIRRLESLDRYSRGRYVGREADRRLFSLWQDGLRRAAERHSSPEKRVLIPLVASSGLGKTSLLAQFAERSSLHAPVLLLLARDVSLDTDDSLLRAVIDRLQGSIDAEARLSEETAVATIFQGKTPLTVVLDGLDETSNSTSLRRAISGWLSSRLGSISVLITSSRIEFWRSCRDAAWRSSILSEVEPERVAKPLRFEEAIASLDPMQGIEIPGQFEVHELTVVWDNAGRSTDELWALSSAVRERLRHPFAASSALELLARGVDARDLSSVPNILEIWVQRRLELDSDNTDRISAELLRKALLAVAVEAQKSDGSWVTVDHLTNAPRFDSHRPPGPVVERLLKSGLLETKPGHSDQIRFAVEAIQDFFIAELTIERISSDPSKAAAEFEAMQFSKAVSRLEPIGAQIVGMPYAEIFVTQLAAIDAAKAAVAMRPGLQSYSTECRRIIAEALGKMQHSRFEAEQALAAELLGRMPCNECKEELRRCWSQKPLNDRLRPVIARAAIAQGIVDLVGDVFQTWWFIRDDFLVDLGPELAASPEEFKHALSQFARGHLNALEPTEEYRRAIMVLAYLKDSAFIAAIDDRTQDSHPFFYESLALIRIGSIDALELYRKLVDRYLVEKGDADVVNEEFRRWAAVFPFPQRIGCKPTKQIEEYSIELIRASDENHQHAGRSLARIAYSVVPFVEMIHKGWMDTLAFSNSKGIGRLIGSDLWLELWNTATELKTKESLISIASDLRDSRVEDVLILSLQSHELCGRSAFVLGQIGSNRACPALRALLNEARSFDSEPYWVLNVVNSLISLRDEASIDAIADFMKSDVADSFTQYESACGVASIGTPRAEETVLKMDWVDDEVRVSALMHFGSYRCVTTAVELAKRPGRGVKWLLKAARHSFFGRGWSSDTFRSDVEIAPLLEYARAALSDAETCDYLDAILDDLDGAAVREQYAHWWSLRGTPDDIELKSHEGRMISDVARRELERRGDNRVLLGHLEEEIEFCTKYRAADHVSGKLAVYSKLEVLEALRTLLLNEQEEKRIVPVIDIIGRMGESSDASTLQKIADASNSTRIANAAFEAVLRLTDPMRLSQYW